MATEITPSIYKKVLENGLTILVRPNHIIPKVSIQLWYNVGSKDENRGQKGFAHLIEHMIFKGTKNLSESDINLITYKLSGTCNAFTSYDYTGYLFNMPTHHWEQALPIMADCMRNCTMEQEYINSEMKAVIQELKMYRDNYASSLVEHMLGAIFHDHPYHYPIIGYKQDLWKANQKALLDFYHTHYIPNNATLVIVGDVEPEQTFDLANKSFGKLKPDFSYRKEQFHHARDLISDNVILYRDVAQPIVMLAWQVPGAQARKDYVLDVLSWILGSGKGSRLQKLLVDDLQLVTELETFAYDLFEYGLFFLFFQPKKIEEIEKIITIIDTEIDTIKKQGATLQEFERAAKKTQMAYFSVLEDNEKQAYLIGQGYLATGDENYLFNYINYPIDELPAQIAQLTNAYFHKTWTNRGMVLPISTEDKPLWHELQQRSDQEDQSILSQISRTVPVQAGSHVNSISVQQPKKFDFPKSTKTMLKNGLRLLYYHNPNVPTIDLILNLKAKHYYDPEDKQGLNYFMSALLQEGTKQKSGGQLAAAIESRGMTLHTAPGAISMSALQPDLEFGLQILNEILTESVFSESAIEKVRAQIIAQVKEYWDTPMEFVGALAAKHVYRNHPYHKQVIGDLKSIESITRDDIIKAYRNFISPIGATLAIVGDLANYSIPALVQNCLPWKGAAIKDIEFPKLQPVNEQTIDYKIVRDQIVLAFAGLSVSRLDDAFDKLLIFDQIFTGGVLGAMSSRLFQLREQTGLFYTIGGSLLHHADEQPGMIFIRTLVSIDRLQEAEQVIAHVINVAADGIVPEELDQAKNALVNSFIDNFESNKNIATTFLLLERFGLPDNYFDYRPKQLFEVKKEDIITVVKKLLTTQHLIKIRVGRV